MNLQKKMKQENFILATDYKHNFFSAIFSFTVSKKDFYNFDKVDLLHSFMVFRIIQKVKECSEDYFEPENPLINNAFKQITKVVNELIKQRSNSIENMEKSIKLIKEMYPEETLQIEKNTEDDTGIMACCFFAPNVLLEFINEFNENKLNIQLFDIDLNQTINNDSKIYSELIDSFTGLLEGGMKFEEAKSAVKKTIQLNLIASGELQKHIENEQK